VPAKVRIGDYRTRSRLITPRVIRLYVDGKRSHSPDEKAVAFNVLAAHVILDDQAEEGWKRVREGYRPLIEHMRQRTGADYPEPAGKLADWYMRCIEAAKAVNDRLASLDAMLDCALVAIMARAAVARPTAVALT